MKRSSSFLMLALLASCKTETKQAAPEATASASAVAPAAAPTPAAAQPAWFVGEFTGQYEAKLVPVEIKVGAVREWAKDDGQASSGPGKLSLKIAEDGTVDGTSEGALGAAHVTGKVEEDMLRIQLQPSDDAGLHGVLVASREGDGFKGAINASSGDSLRVRQAAIELKKQAN